MESPKGKAFSPKSLRPLPAIELFAWGVVTRPHGLRGHVLVKTLSQQPQAYPLSAFWLAREGDKIAQPYRVASLHPYKTRHPEDAAPPDLWLLRLRGVSDRNAAENLRQLYLYLPRTYLPPLEAGRFYYFEAEGAQVVDLNEGPKGRLREIRPGQAHDFFIVEAPEGALYWVPAPFIRQLDRTTSPPTLFVEGIEGLWDPSLAQGRP